jgi:hypothetical protein
MRFRKIFWLTALAIIIGLPTACKKLSELTQFTMEYEESIVIPSTIGLNLPFNLATPKIRTNSEDTFEINNTRKNLVEEVVLEQLTLKITDPADADFSFLRSIEIYLSAESQEEILVAWIYDIDNSIGNSITLETSVEDLAPYIVQDEFTLRFSTVTDKIPLTDHYIDISARFFVDARILGL